ncbi:Hsp33 family molecular chaperone HslO, partial [Escherichia coli]|uniref:Hsp33 family molecular chaperone HslO n=1 Tax=Escherichia coli TaxID=562 RepID=UPI003CF0D444
KGERYQGIVALDGENIEACMDNYFKQSEQLPTRVFIRSGIQEGKPAAAGMLLQVLPASEEFTAEHTAEHFELLTQLTHTIKAEELFTL